MKRDISNNKKKYAYLLLLIVIFISNIIYLSRIDIFSPKHLVVVKWVIQWGFLPSNDYSVSLTPLFYLLWSQLELISGINLYKSMFYPIFGFYYGIILYLISYKLSKNPVISGLVSIFLMITNTVGYSLKLWPHAVGYLLFLTFLLCLIEYKIILRNFKRVFIITIISIVIPGFSYTYSYMAITMLGAMLFGIYIKYKIDNNKYGQFEIKAVGILLVGLLMSQLMLYGTYRIILPTLLSVELNPIGLFKIINYYLMSTGNTPMSECISRLIYESPRILSVVLSAKYILIITMLLVITIEKMKALLHHKIQHIAPASLTILALWIASITWMLIKLSMGQLAIPIIILPSLFTIIHQPNNNTNKLLTIFLLIITCIGISQQIIISATHSIHSFPGLDTTYYAAPSKFIENKISDNTRNIKLTTDEFTRNLIVMYYSPINFISPSEMIYSTMKIYSMEELCIPKNKDVYNMFAINCDENIKYTSTLRWNLIKSPCIVQKKYNMLFNKIYQTPFLSLYITTINQS